MAFTVIGFDQESRVYEIFGADPVDADVQTFLPGSRLFRAATGGSWQIRLGPADVRVVEAFVPSADPTFTGTVTADQLHVTGSAQIDGDISSPGTGFHNLDMGWYQPQPLLAPGPGRVGRLGNINVLDVLLNKASNLHTIAFQLVDGGGTALAPTGAGDITVQWLKTDPAGLITLVGTPATISGGSLLAQVIVTFSGVLPLLFQGDRLGMQYTAAAGIMNLANLNIVAGGIYTS